MAKKINWLGILFAVVSLIVTIGIGGLFINGTFLNTVILSWFPEIVHTIVGWITIVGGIVGAVASLMK